MTKYVANGNLKRGKKLDEIPFRLTSTALNAKHGSVIGFQRGEEDFRKWESLKT
jgi:hypothetical protein